MRTENGGAGPARKNRSPDRPVAGPGRGRCTGRRKRRESGDSALSEYAGSAALPAGGPRKPLIFHAGRCGKATRGAVFQRAALWARRSVICDASRHPRREPVIQFQARWSGLECAISTIPGSSRRARIRDYSIGRAMVYRRRAIATSVSEPKTSNETLEGSGTKANCWMRLLVISVTHTLPLIPTAIPPASLNCPSPVPSIPN